METLGSTTVICSDKTGTLTENKMTVQAIVAGDRLYSVTGVGYDPEDGEVTGDGIQVTAPADSALAECLLAGIACNDRLLVEKEGQWQVQGDPTEGALLVAAGKAGLPWSPDRLHFRRLDTIPFVSHQQYMAVLVQDEGGQARHLYLKGGLEVVLDACERELNEADLCIIKQCLW